MVHNVTLDVDPHGTLNAAQRFEFTNRLSLDLIQSLMEIYNDKHNEKLQTQVQDRLVQVILKHRRVEQEEEDDEGFESGDSPERQSLSNKVVRKRYDVRTKDGRRRSSLFFELQDTETQVELLQRRVKELEKLLEEMTSGFFKDMTHFKSMLQRDDPDEELFEVTYFDCTKMLDDRSKQVVEHYLGTLKLIYQGHVQSLRVKFMVLEEEAEKLRKQTNILLSKTDAYQLVKLAYALEKNPYKFWKYIQDIVGNEVIFKVFDQQQHTHGINYKQIDQILAQSQASHRMFQQVKDKMDEQLAILGKRASYEITLLKNRLAQLNEKEALDTNQLKHNDFEQLEYIREIVRKELSNREEIRNDLCRVKVRRKHATEMKAWISDWETVDTRQLIYEAVVRSAMQRWSLTVKFSRLSNTITKTLFELEVNYKQRQQTEDSIRSYTETSLKIKQHLFELRKSLISKGIKKLKRQDTDFEQQIHKLNLDLGRSQFYLEEANERILVLEGDIRVLKLLNSSFKIRIDQLELQLMQNEEYTVRVKAEKQKLELSLMNYEKAFNFLMGKLGFKQHEMPTNLVDQRFAKQIKKLQMRIKNIKMDDIISMEEFSEFYAKTDYVYMNLSNLGADGAQTVDQETLTHYFNLHYSLSQLEQKNETEIQAIESLLYKPKKQDKETQVDIKSKDSNHASIVQRPGVASSVQSFEPGPGSKHHSTIEDQTLFKQNLVDQILKEESQPLQFLHESQLAQLVSTQKLQDSYLQQTQLQQTQMQQTQLLLTQSPKQANPQFVRQQDSVCESQLSNYEEHLKQVKNLEYPGGQQQQRKSERRPLRYDHHRTESDAPSKMILSELRGYGQLLQPKHLKTHHIESWMTGEIMQQRTERDRLLKMIEHEKQSKIKRSRNKSLRQEPKTQNSPRNIRIRPIYSIDKEQNNPYMPQTLEQIEMLRTHFPPENILRHMKDIEISISVVGKRTKQLSPRTQHMHYN